MAKTHSAISQVSKIILLSGFDMHLKSKAMIFTNALEITALLIGYMVIVLVLYENPSNSRQLEIKGQ